MTYEEYDGVLELLLPAMNISVTQMRIIHKITKMNEIKRVELRVNRLPGMQKLRRPGWMESEIGVFGVVEDERILNTLCEPPEGEGIINFLKRYDLAKYVFFGPFQVPYGKGMGVGLCVGGMKHQEESMDDVHNHIRLELMTQQGFDEEFRFLNRERRNLVYCCQMPHGS